MQTHIYEYVYNNKRQPVGLVVASKSDQTVFIGWSKCNTSLGDKFDKARALQIALGRANNAGGIDPLPHSLHDAYERIYDRARRYFKGADIAE